MEQINFESLRQEDVKLREREDIVKLQESIFNQTTTEIPEEEKKKALKDIREFMARCQKAGKHIAEEQERNSLRVLLRYWSTFVYNVSGVYHRIDLEDLNIPAPQRRIKLSLAFLLVVGVAVLLVGAAASLFILHYSSVTVLSPTAMPQTIPAPTASPRLPRTATPSASAVTLTNLQDGQTVPCQNIVRGTYPLDLKDYIWPIVYVGGRYYPQDGGGKAAQKVGGNWYQTVRFGDCNQPQEDVGRPFQLIIITANESANTEFEEYIKAVQASGSWPGLIELPPGIVEHVLITVIRQ
jgi:hypothetical protein